MACFGAKLAWGAAGAAMIAAGGAEALAIPADVVVKNPAPTVAASVALLAAIAGYIAACIALHDCLQSAGKEADAAKLQRQIDSLQEKQQRLQQWVDAHR